jgi:tetratricopeptide (TPR) repeat protein
MSLGDSEPAEVAAWLEATASELGIEPNIEGFEQLLDVAEDANEVGLGWLARAILAECRRLQERLEVGTERYLVLARIENVEGIADTHAGYLDPAEDRFLAAIENARRAGSLFAEALARQNLAGVRWLAQGTAQARDQALAALRIYEDLGDRFRQAQILVKLANYDVADKQFDRALERLDRAQALATARVARGIRTSIIGTRAAVATAQGDLDLAGKYHRQVLARVRRGDTLANTRAAAQNMGAWYADTGTPRLAALWMERAAALALKEGNATLAATLRRSQAIQQMASADLRSAESTEAIGGGD